MMVVKKHKGKVYGATFTAAEKQAIELEVRRQLLEFDEQYTHDLCDECEDKVKKFIEFQSFRNKKE